MSEISSGIDNCNDHALAGESGVTSVDNLLRDRAGRGAEAELRSRWKLECCGDLIPNEAWRRNQGLHNCWIEICPLAIQWHEQLHEPIHCRKNTRSRSTKLLPR